MGRNTHGKITNHQRSDAFPCDHSSTAFKNASATASVLIDSLCFSSVVTSRARRLRRVLDDRVKVF